MDELKKKIDLVPVRDDVIKSKQIPHKELWLIKDARQDVFGPFETKSIKDYAHKYQYLFEEAHIYNLETKTWKSFFSLPQFQRRKPQLVAAQNLLPTEEFIVKKDNHNFGPYNQDEMEELLKKGEILPASKISLDNGVTWIKLYEHHAFDRRKKRTNQDLPFAPGPQNVGTSIQDKNQKSKETQDAIVGLAFIGQNDKSPNHTKTKEQNKILKKVEKAINKENLGSTPFFQWWKVSLASALVLSLVFFGQSQLFNDESSTNKSAEVKTESKSINNSARTNIKRLPASVKKHKEKSYNPSKIRKKIKAKAFSKKKKAKRIVQTHKEVNYENENTFEEDIENLDINDPEVQDELTRQLAGESEHLSDLQEDDERMEDDMPEEFFDEETRIMHENEDY